MCIEHSRRLVGPLSNLWQLTACMDCTPEHKASCVLYVQAYGPFNGTKYVEAVASVYASCKTRIVAYENQQMRFGCKAHLSAALVQHALHS